MNRTAGFFLVGLVAGAVIGTVVAVAVSSGGDTEQLEREIANLRTAADRSDREVARSADELEMAQTKLTDLQRRHDEAMALIEKTARTVARLEDQASASPETPVDEPEPETPVVAKGFSDEELKGRIMTLGGRIQRLIMSGKADTLKKEMQDLLAEGGPGTLDRILDMYREAEGQGPKFVLAHALAQTGDPKAIELLKADVLDPDGGLIARRSAAHGLAFSDEESLETFYRQVATSDIERGTRANLTYGLALRSDDGIELYAKTVDEAFAANDPIAIGYLSGFMLLGKRAVPVVEKRLRTIKEQQARLMMIGHLAEHGSADSIPLLREIAADAEASKDVRDAAEKAAVKLAQANPD